MSKEDLLSALEQQGDQELSQLRRDAQERLVALRQEYAARLRLARRDQCSQLMRLRRNLQQEHLNRCEREIRERLTQHRWEMAEASRELARGLLPQLWQEHRRELLARLAAELPAISWTTIQVRPQDLQLARALFRDVDVVAIEGLEGGLVAENSDSGLTVDASLETCLDRLLPVLLPRLLEVIDDVCRR